MWTALNYAAPAPDADPLEGRKMRKPAATEITTGTFCKGQPDFIGTDSPRQRRVMAALLRRVLEVQA